MQTVAFEHYAQFAIVEEQTLQTLFSKYWAAVQVTDVITASHLLLRLVELLSGSAQLYPVEHLLQIDGLEHYWH